MWEGAWRNGKALRMFIVEEQIMDLAVPFNVAIANSCKAQIANIYRVETILP